MLICTGILNVIKVTEFFIFICNHFNCNALGQLTKQFLHPSCVLGMVVCGPLDPSPSPPLYVIDALSSSPLPNKTYAFQREPPEGCERVRVCEEAL